MATYNKTVAAKEKFSAPGINANATDYSNITITTAKNGLYNDDGNSINVKSIGTLNLTNGQLGGIFGEFYAQKSIGAVNIIQQGGNGWNGGNYSNDVDIFALSGNVGNVTVTTTGVGGSGHADILATGNVGNIVVNNNGAGAEYELDATALKSVGNVTINANGKASSANVSAFADVEGNLGNINLTATGAFSDIDFSGHAYGNIGTITAVARGFSAVVDVSASAFGGVAASGNIGAINLTAQGTESDAYIDILALENVGNVSLSATGLNSFASGYLTYVSGNVGNINLSATGIDSYARFDADNLAGVYGTIGNVTLTASNTQAGVDFEGYASGNIGNLNLSATRQSSDAYLQATSLDGNIGTVAVNATGNSASASAYVNASGTVGNITVTAAGQAASGDLVALASGNIGNVTLAATGFNTDINSVYIESYNGNIGNISLNNAGTRSYSDFSAYASANIGSLTLNGGGTDSYYSAYVYAGGNIGPITMNGAGVDSSGFFSAFADGNVGNTTINATGSESDYSAYIEASGNIGTLTLNAAGASADASADVYIYNSGSVGNVTVTSSNVESEASAYIETSGFANNVTVNATGVHADAYVDLYTSGAIGNVTVTATNDSAYASAYVSAGDGSVGNLSVRATGANSDAYVDASAGGNGNIGTLTVLASGNNSYAEGSATTDAGNIGNIVATSKGIDTGVQAYANTDGGNIGSITITASAEDSYADAYVDASGGTVGNVTLNATGVGADTYFSAGGGENSLQTLSDISVNVTGTEASGYVQFGYYDWWDGDIEVGAEDVGNITYNLTGLDAFGSLDGFIAGSVDKITVNATGTESDFNSDFSAGGGVSALVLTADNSSEISAYIDIGVGEFGEDSGDVSLDTVNLTAKTADSSVFADVYVSGGSIGTTTLTTTAELGWVDFDAVIYNDENVDANIGAVTINQAGDGSHISAYLEVDSSGGANSIGNVTANLTGDGAHYHVNYSGSAAAIGTHTATLNANGAVYQGAFVRYNVDDSSVVGNINITAIQNASSFGNDVTVDFSGFNGSELSDVNLTLQNAEAGSGYMGLSAYAYTDQFGSGGTIGNVQLDNFTQGGSTYAYMMAAEVGNVSGKVGAGEAIFSAYFSAGASAYYTSGITGSGGSGAVLNIGDINVDVNADNTFLDRLSASGNVNIQFNVGGDIQTVYTDIGQITVSGGSVDSEAYIEIDSNNNWAGSAEFTGTMDGIDLTTFEGSAFVNVSAFMDGTTIEGAKGENILIGSQGDDTINGQTANDYFSGNDGADSITGGLGADTFAYSLNTNDSSAELSSGFVGDVITDFQVGESGDYIYSTWDLVKADTSSGGLYSYSGGSNIDGGYLGSVIGGSGGTFFGDSGIDFVYAAINDKGVATFDVGTDTLQEKVDAIMNSIWLNGDGDVDGQSVIFEHGSDAYLFISDGDYLLDDDDVLIKLAGLDLTPITSDEINITDDPFGGAYLQIV